MKRHDSKMPVTEEINSTKMRSTILNHNNEVDKKNRNNNINGKGGATEIREDELQAIIKDVKLQRIRENIKRLETETLQHMSQQLSALVDGVLGELERFDDKKDDRLFGGEVISARRLLDRETSKKFVSRASPLSELLEVRHLRSLYHIFIAGLIIAMVSGILGDALSGGVVHFGVRYVPSAFQGFDRAILIWIGMFIAACSAYPLLALWARSRNSLTHPNTWQRWCWDRLWVTGFLSFITADMLLVAFILGPNTGPGSAAFVLLEQTRLLMKVHAFIRSNVPHFLQTNSSSAMIPPFSRYLYFLFAPTLIYRDYYPRTSNIRWRFVAGCLVEFFGAALMLSCIFEYYISPEFNSFGIKPYTRGALVASIFRTVLPASVFVLCGFYLFLHSWMNASAEILQFADRRFYGPWWNATSYGEYYRTWNTVVHDYLHIYVYQDVHALTGNKIAGKWAVFAVSALVHEWIIALMLGFCYPVMFVQFFGIGSTLGFVRSAAGKGRAANIFLWCSLACGLGLQISLYSMEAFARINCPKEHTEFIEYFIPRSWSCNGLPKTS